MKHLHPRTASVALALSLVACGGGPASGSGDPSGSHASEAATPPVSLDGAPLPGQPSAGEAIAATGEPPAPAEPPPSTTAAALEQPSAASHPGSDSGGSADPSSGGAGPSGSDPGSPDAAGPAPHAGGAGHTGTIGADAPTPATPVPETAIAPPTEPLLSLSTGFKSLHLEWTPVPQASSYQLLRDPDGAGAAPAVVEADLPVPSGERVASARVTASVQWWAEPAATFRLRACNPAGCAESADLTPELERTAGMLKPQDVVRGAGFGHALAISRDGGTLAVVSPTWWTAGFGALSVFTRDEQGWTETRLAQPITDRGLSEYGFSVAMSGDGGTIALGLPSEGGAGQVRFFERRGTGWAGDQVLHGPEGGAQFGTSVALSADGLTLAVGMPNAGNGAVYLAGRPGREAGFHELATRRPESFAQQFGSQLSLSADGRTLVAASTLGQGDDQRPAVGVMRRFGEHWSRLAILDASTALEGGSLALSADGGILAVGLPLLGQVQVHAWQGDRYAPLQTLSLPDPSHRFGSSVSLSADGRLLAIGAVGDPGRERLDGRIEGRGDGPAPGAIHLFRRGDDGFRPMARLKTGPGLPATRIGAAHPAGGLSWPNVVLSGDGRTLAAGDLEEGSLLRGLHGFPAPGNEQAPRSGAVYLY